MHNAFIRKLKIPYKIIFSDTQLQNLAFSSLLVHWFFFFFLKKKNFFLKWTIFKVFIEFVTILLLIYVSVFWLRGMWDLSSPAREWTHTRGIGRQSLNHWTAREVPSFSFLVKAAWLPEVVLRLCSNKVKTSSLFCQIQQQSRDLRPLTPICLFTLLFQKYGS